MFLQKKSVWSLLGIMFFSINFLCNNPPAIHIAPHFNTHYHSENKNQNNQGGQELHAALQNSATIKSNIENKITTNLKMILSKALKKSIDTKNNFYSFCKTYKLHFFIAGISATYVYFLYVAQNCTYLIQNKDSWCCWRPDLETFDLETTIDNTFCNILLKDIQAKYMIKQINTEPFNPFFSEFIKDIKSEMNQLKAYIQLYKITHKLQIKKIFFINETTFILAKEKLERLYFLYKSFIDWYTEQKLHLVSK